ncbi:putative serine/threonine-protein kinase PBL1 [Senna tora]|uniref:Putative serine/threonine-protein kinase PBL1 n=1 Tax=Senna tora TaxID=362788 RepID=A0A834XII2_9FABA|nr:putative serine/threonine-protein kinase PBL1 [Senna tora]
MGCFTVLKSKKKKTEQIMHVKRANHKEHLPTVLPEPQTHTRSLQSAPPSFRTRVKPIQPVANKVANNRTRALSAPSTLDVAEQDALASEEYDEQDELKHRAGSIKEQRSSSPQPLPLPSPQGGVVLKATSSFKSGTASGPLYASGPLPLPPTGSLRNFMYEEIAAACHNFSSDRCMSEGLSSVIFKASFGDDASSSKKFEATVTRLHPSTQGLKDFISEVNTIASLQHPNLCKLLGFHARDGSEQRMLVYERLFHGSLDRLLYGRSDGPPIDWNTRMKIALCAAQGLTFLHEEGPFQAMYNEFSTANIQIDKDFSAKLSGYGCVGHIPEEEIVGNSSAVGNLSVETLERGMLTPKSNVWSFGIVLLELLTGRKNLDSRHPKEERNLVKWSRPFLADDCRLSLIMDPQLKGRFPSKAARTVSDIALRCLQKEPSERPTMRTVVEHLKKIQDMKHSCRFPLQEPAAISGKQMLRSPSLNGIISPTPRLSFSPSPPSAARPSISPPRWSGVPILLPPRACSSNFSLEELDRQECRKSSSSTSRRASVEGFSMAETATFMLSSFSTIFRGSTPFPSFSLSSKPSLLPMRHFNPTPSTTRIYALTSNDIKVGINIEVDGAPWRVLEFLHVKPGKGAAFVRTKMRNYLSGNTIEKTFRAGSSIEEANIVKETKQFTYKDGSQFVFMDLNTFEEIRLLESEVGDRKKWLKEGMDCNLLLWNGKVIDLDLPITVKLSVVDVDPGLKGDTAQGGSKPATLDTGAVVNVPLFINVGDEILVDTRTGQYMSRA